MDSTEKPLSSEEELALLRQKVAALEAENNWLKEENLKWKQLADHDPVTNLLNLRGFNSALENQLAQLKRHPERSATLLAFDLDDFKLFNDQHGHPAGDRLLKLIAQVVQEQTRVEDIKAAEPKPNQTWPKQTPNNHYQSRTGGDEFLIALIDADVQGANKVADRLRMAITAKAQEVFGWEQTISLGLSPVEPADTAESWREKADKALYAAKHRGKNQSAVYPPAT